MSTYESDHEERGRREREDLLRQVRALEDEVAHLRRRLSDGPGQARALEERIANLQTNLAGVTSQNERLAQTLRDAREQIVTLKAEVDRLAQPPAGYGTFIDRHEDGTVDVFTAGRKMRVAVSPAVDVSALHRGQEVLLNEAMNVVAGLRLRDGRRDRHAQGAAGRRAPRPGDRRTPTRSAWCGWPRRCSTSRCVPATRCWSRPGPATPTSGSPRPRSRSWSSRRSRTSTTPRSAGWPARSSRSATLSSCPTCTRSCSASTSCGPPRGSCSMGRPGAARP